MTEGFDAQAVGAVRRSPAAAALRRGLVGILLVNAVVDLVAVLQGPHEVLVAAKVDFREAATSVQIEASCERAERRLRANHPQIEHVYLDPTARGAA